MINNVVILGRICNDFQMRQTPGGASVVRFNVAVDRNFKSKDGERDTDFISIIAWRGVADFIFKYFKKGSLIGITGSLRSGKFTDKKGVDRYFTEVLAESCTFAGFNKNDVVSSPALINQKFDRIGSADDLSF